MAAKVVVQDLDARVDGEYDLVTVDDWDHNEFHKIKKLTGLVAGDFLAADDAGSFDFSVLFALAVVAAERAGKPRPEAWLGRAKLANITIVGEEEEVDVDPPDQQEPKPDDAGESGSSETESDETTSGTDTEKPSEGGRVIDLPPTGTQG